MTQSAYGNRIEYRHWNDDLPPVHTYAGLTEGEFLAQTPIGVTIASGSPGVVHATLATKGYSVHAKNHLHASAFCAVVDAEKEAGETEYCDTCWGVGELMAGVLCPDCKGLGVVYPILHPDREGLAQQGY